MHITWIRRRSLSFYREVDIEVQNGAYTSCNCQSFDTKVDKLDFIDVIQKSFS